jgi:hypothetical protein
MNLIKRDWCGVNNPDLHLDINGRLKNQKISFAVQGVGSSRHMPKRVLVIIGDHSEEFGVFRGWANDATKCRHWLLIAVPNLGEGGEAPPWKPRA